MTTLTRENDYLLPERARLFHIGQAKTGTTALQVTAARKRDELLAHGVLYPDERHRSHRRAVAAFMGKPIDGKAPPRSMWDELQSLIHAELERRVWISYESTCGSSDETAAAFCEAIGGALHIVVTLRHYGDLLASRWQQGLKHGAALGLDDQLRAVLAEQPDAQVTSEFHRSTDQAGIVRRWAKIVGSENVTVIVTDKAQPTLISDAFEGLLGLPQGMLSPIELDREESNRTMSLQEAELIRAINAVFRPEDDHGAYVRYMPRGVVRDLLRNNEFTSDDMRIALPSWAAERASEIGRRYADEIAASGVRVIGDLDVLRVPARAEGTPATTSLIRLDMASTAVLGAIDAGRRREQVLHERSKTALDAARQEEKAKAEVRSKKLRAELAAKTRELRAAEARLRQLSQRLRAVKAKGPAMSSVRASGLLIEFARRVWRRIRPR